MKHGEASDVPAQPAQSATAQPGKVGAATVTAAAGKRRELKFDLNQKGERAVDDQKQLKIALKIDIRVGRVEHVTTTRSFGVQRP